MFFAVDPATRHKVTDVFLEAKVSVIRTVVRIVRVLHVIWSLTIRTFKAIFESILKDFIDLISSGFTFTFLLRHAL